MILIVDDTPENLISLRKVLEINGFEVDTAASGEEALRKVLKTSYVLIILDVQMPDMDGFEVASAISGFSKARDTAIIFLSAVNTETQFVKQGYSSGGLDYITKPVDINILLLKVKTFYRIYEQSRKLIEMKAKLLEEIEFRKEAENKKDEFISVASHELKTPLTSIKGYLQLLHRTIESRDEEKIKKQLTKVEDQVEKLHQLVVDLLDISRIESGELKLNKAYFSLDKLLDQVIENARQTNPDHDIKRNGYAGAQVFADEMRLEQVLVNFITNAVKYSPGKNEININVKILPGKLYIGVQDFGIGIGSHDLANIFNKFYRVEEVTQRFHGLGIGLFICRQIIEKHGGEIGAKSVPGEGSEFYFCIPVESK